MVQFLTGYAPHKGFLISQQQVSKERKEQRNAFSMSYITTLIELRYKNSLKEYKAALFING